jgi:tmRNA-binding protein
MMSFDIKRRNEKNVSEIPNRHKKCALMMSFDILNEEMKKNVSAEIILLLIIYHNITVKLFLAMSRGKRGIDLRPRCEHHGENTTNRNTVDEFSYGKPEML